MEELENIDDPNQPTVTEELLQIIEEFADYIDKFMFEIVTFLAVVDSSMGLIKDVLGMFGFAGWKMTFFPSFSFVVTIGVFLFGSKKRKGKRKAEAEQLEGLEQAMDMVEDVFEVMDDVMDEIEEVEGEAGALGLGDYSDSDDEDDDGIKAETNAIEETSGNDDAMDKIDVVTTENNQEFSQQDVKVEAEPPKSTLRKVIGIAIIATRIASKLAKKKQENQEDQQQEDNNDNVGGPGEGNDVGGESMTGANAPPTDDKSKHDNKISIQSTVGGLGLGDDGAELKNEAAGLVEAVKEDSLKTAELVKAGSLGANNVVQGGTKQVLASTGALKVGHGLYREADFITGHLHKEGKVVAKSLEKDTKEKTKQIKDNEIVKATGVEKASTAVSREATFIAGHVNQEAKKVIQIEEQGKIPVKQIPSTSESKRSLSSSQKGKKETATECKTQNVHPPSKNSSTTARQEKETQGKTNSVSVAGTSKQQQSTEIRCLEQGHPIPYETPPKSIAKSFSDLSKTVGDLDEEKKGRKEASKPLGNQEPANLTESTALKGGKEPKQASESAEIQEDPERLIHDPLPGTIPGTVPDMAGNVIGGAAGAAGATAASQAKQGLQQTGKKSKGLLQIAMRLVRLIMRVAKKRGSSAPSSQNSSRRESTTSGTGSLGGVPAKGKRSASGGGDGSVPDIAGAAANIAMGSAGAKGGKIGAIVGIVVRVVRLASKLKRGKQDPPSSSLRSSKESIGQESDSEFFDCDEEFATQEIQTQTEERFPLLSVATQTTNTDAGSTWSMVTRDSRDLTDMRSGPGSTWTARESGDLSHTRNDPGTTWTARDSGNVRNTRNDPGSTWTARDSGNVRNTRNDPGSTWTARDSGNPRDLRNDEDKKDLTRYVKAFQAARVGPNEGPFTESQTKGGEEMYQSTSKEMPNPKHHETFSQDADDHDNHFFEDQTRELNTSRNDDDSRVNNQPLISRELRGTNPQGLIGTDRESTPKRTSTGSLQRITLKILNPTDSSSTEATNNSLLLDIDAPVVLHSTREFRSPANDVTLTNDVNMVATGKQQHKEERSLREERRRSPKDDISKEECPGRRGKHLKSSSVDLDEMEKQTHQSRAAARRDLRADSREWSERGSIVPYSSSSEDLEDCESVFQRRRPTVVRFEDECVYSFAYDEDEPITSYREMKTRNRTQRRSNGLKKYSSLEKLDYRFPEDRDNGDDGLSIVRDSGCDQESTRLLSEYEKPTLQSSNTFAARKSKLSGSRTSYFGDDESDQPGALC